MRCNMRTDAESPGETVYGQQWRCTDKDYEMNEYGAEWNYADRRINEVKLSQLVTMRMYDENARINDDVYKGDQIQLSAQSMNVNCRMKCSNVKRTSGARWRQENLVDQLALLPKDYVWLEGL